MEGGDGCHASLYVHSFVMAGQPSTWNEISGECISLINSVVTRLGGQLQSQRVQAGSLIPTDIPTGGYQNALCIRV